MHNSPWNNYPEIWKTQSAFFSWLRGGIRRSLWSKSPIKLEFLRKNRKKIKNPNPKGKVATVWGATCKLCNNDFPLNNIEVDHITGNHSLTCISDIQTFIEGIVLVSEKDLQLVCKPCHKNKTMAERKGISLDEARIEKEVIRIIKEKQDKQWLLSRGLVPASNEKKRREQIRELLKEECNASS